MSEINIKSIVVGPVGTNCFIIYDDKNCFIIDPGAGFKRIKDFIKRNELNPKMIINTHGHYDHIGANKNLYDFFDIPIWVHENDKNMLNNPKKNASIFSIKKVISPEADRLLKNGDTFKSVNKKWQILHTPGHTMGSICIECSGENILFTGDTLFKQGWGRTDLPGGNKDKIKESLLKLIKIDRNYHCYSGHGSDFLLEDRKNDVRNLLKNFVD